MLVIRFHLARLFSDNLPSMTFFFIITRATWEAPLTLFLKASSILMCALFCTVYSQGRSLGMIPIWEFAR